MLSLNKSVVCNTTRIKIVVLSVLDKLSLALIQALNGKWGRGHRNVELPHSSLTDSIGVELCGLSTTGNMLVSVYSDLSVSSYIFNKTEMRGVLSCLVVLPLHLLFYMWVTHVYIACCYFCVLYVATALFL